MRIIEYVSRKKKVTLVLAIVVLVGIWMYVTDTLLYPYIMTQRQIQLIRYCVHPDTVFMAKPYDFTFAVPKGYCALPHRLFPEDGTVHVVPQGYYFVINEYARGTITENAVATLLFIRDKDGSDTRSSITSLRLGGFVNDAIYSETINSHGVEVTEYRNATGIQPERKFDWAFVTNTKSGTAIKIITDKVEQTDIYDEVIQGIQYEK